MTIDFNIKRLFQLLRKQWVENARLYLYSTLALLGLLGLVFLIWITTSERRFDGEVIAGIFLFGLFISGAAFASMSFKMLESKNRGIYWLSLPASHLEKLICMIIFNLLFFTIVYCICFYVVEKTAMAYVLNLIKREPHKYYLRKVDWQSEGGFATVLPYFLMAFFAVQALYLLGSVYFKRFPFMLTTIILAFLTFTIGYYVIKLMTSLPTTFFFRNTAVYEQIGNTENYQKFRLNPFLINSGLLLLKYIWAPIFWLVAWFRLKEKEI